jgi:hypothetical protein
MKEVKGVLQNLTFYLVLLWNISCFMTVKHSWQPPGHLFVPYSISSVLPARIKIDSIKAGSIR